MLAGIVEAIREIDRGGLSISERSGLPDILVFLPGEREIRDAADAIGAAGFAETEVLPLFARLSNEQQDRVFIPGAARRIVLATNVAETSLTVPRIRGVIDTGLARIARYSPRRRVQRLPIEAVAGGGIEVVGTPQLPLQFLELNACRIGIGGHQFADGPQSHGRVLLQCLGPHFPHRSQVGQFVRDALVTAGIHGSGGGGRGIDPRGRCREVFDRFRDGGGRILVGERLLKPLHGDRLHQRGLHIIGIASQRCRGQAKG